jgi:hypothetical protein
MALAALSLLPLISTAQTTFPINGVKDEDKAIHAFTGATVHVSADRIVEEATLLVQEGKVVQVGAGIEIPKGAVVHDLKGRHIYPSLIDVHSTYGVKQPEQDKKGGRGSGRNMSLRRRVHSHGTMPCTPRRDAAALFQPDDKKS